MVCSNRRNSCERLNSSRSVRGIGGAVDTLINDISSKTDELSNSLSLFSKYVEYYDINL